MASTETVFLTVPITAGAVTFSCTEVNSVSSRSRRVQVTVVTPDTMESTVQASAGLDPISAKRLDDLILDLRDSLGATVVVVTHELASIFAIADNSVFLDPETRTMIAQGKPTALRDESEDARVRTFLKRGEP